MWKKPTEQLGKRGVRSANRREKQPRNNCHNSSRARCLCPADSAVRHTADKLSSLSRVRCLRIVEVGTGILFALAVIIRLAEIGGCECPALCEANQSRARFIAISAPGDALAVEVSDCKVKTTPLADAGLATCTGGFAPAERERERHLSRRTWVMGEKIFGESEAWAANGARRVDARPVCNVARESNFDHRVLSERSSGPEWTMFCALL
jgi:hypothetical protein